VTTNLTRLDKAAVATTAAAAAFKVLLWSVGVGLDSAEPWLPFVRWLFALVSFVAFDLVVLAIVSDQRAHGRRWLGTATAAVAALLSGGVALHVAGVIVAPALHAGPALLLFLLALHLSDTRTVTPAVDTPATGVNVAVDARTVVVTQPQPVVDTAHRLGDTGDAVSDTAVDTRPAVVRLVDGDGLTVTAAAQRLGISRQAASKQYNEWRRQ
jgi:hypothetical protein